MLGLMIIQLAGCVLLDQNNRIGLLHRNKKGVTQWELPGGKVEPDEPAEQTAIRELQEELGVIVDVKQRIGGTAFKANDNQYEYAWFLATIEEGTLTIGKPDTFDDFRYFTFHELGTIDLSDNMQQFLQQLKTNKISLPLA